jgi:hypothetical protein
MENAFVAIVPTRPCPLFGRPVHRRDGSHRFRPGASPQALRIPPHDGHPALLDFHRGQRGVTPAFGYGALHPSTSGTSTHLSTSLPSAHYEQVRLPTSARLAASVFPRDESPSAAMPTAPVGSPGSRRRPFVRDAIHDPGGVSPSCVTTADMWPSTTGTVSASTTFSLSGLSFRTPHAPCLRFGPHVAATPARLGSDRSATTLVGRDSHPLSFVSTPAHSH